MGYQEYIFECACGDEGVIRAIAIMVGAYADLIRSYDAMSRARSPSSAIRTLGPIIVRCGQTLLIYGMQYSMKILDLNTS